MFGLTHVRLDEATVVPMFDRERSVVELLVAPGGASWARELVQSHGRELDLRKLRSYASRVGVAGDLGGVLS